MRLPPLTWSLDGRTLLLSEERTNTIPIAHKSCHSAAPMLSLPWLALSVGAPQYKQCYPQCSGLGMSLPRGFFHLSTPDSILMSYQKLATKRAVCGQRTHTALSLCTER